MKTKVFLFLGAFFGTIATSQSSHAYEYFPEFGSVTEGEQSEFETPIALHHEYQSDILAYTPPLDWEYEWLAHEIAIDGTVGSTDASHFMTGNRAKFRKRLSSLFEFRFLFFDESHREGFRTHPIFEAVFWPFQNWLGKDKIAIVLYGEPDFKKRRDDTGLALLYKPNPRHEIRIFNTFVDAARLKRNDQSDTFVEPFTPNSIGFVGRWWSDPEAGKKEFFEYAFRHETKTLWSFPDSLYEYQYWKILASTFFSKELVSGFKLSARIQFDRKFEERMPTSASSSEPFQSWKRDRLMALFRTTFENVSPLNLRLTPGIQFTRRLWKSNSGDVSINDILPHVWAYIPAFGSGATRDEVGVGYEFQIHNVTGPAHLMDPNMVRHGVDHRLNLSYDFRFKDKATIRLIVTGDLDQMFTNKSWQGGNAQFRLYF